MKKHEQIYNIVWIIVGVLICIQSSRMEIWGDEGPGAGFITLATGIGIGMSGLILLLTEKFHQYHKKIVDEFWGYPDRILRAGSVLLVFCIMAFLMPILGYFLASIIIFAVLTQIVVKQSIVKMAVTSIVLSSVSYLFFQYVLKLRLPTGLLNF